MEKVRIRLGFKNMKVTEAEGWKRGTTVLWRDQTGWDVFHSSKWITRMIIPNANGEMWTLWACYYSAEKVKEENSGKLSPNLLKPVPRCGPACNISF